MRLRILLYSLLAAIAALFFALPQQMNQSPTATALSVSQQQYPQWVQMPVLASFEAVTADVNAAINFVALLVLATALVLLRIRYQSKSEKSISRKTLMRIWRASSLSTRERQRTYAF